MKPPAVVIATTTRYARADEIRARLALRTLREARTHRLPVVIVDGGSHGEVLRKFVALGAMVFRERSRRMGMQRRQALAEALQVAGPHGVVVWMEPEKCTFVGKIRSLAEPLLSGRCDLVLPRRMSLASYPPEQQRTESVQDMAFCAATGMAWDVSFGPFLANRRALRYFLRYRGEYGDQWDSIFAPRLRALKVGLRIRTPLVSYVHPRAQTRAETGDPDYFLKRIAQVANVFAALYKEGMRLGIVKKRD